MNFKRIKYFFILFVFFNTTYQWAQCSLLDAGEDTPVNCADTTADLEAKVFSGIGSSTETYEVIAADPCPLPPSTSTTPTGITEDDVWSDIIDLPFTFYFFGQAYTQIIIGANGVISFDLNNTDPEQAPNGTCAWQFAESLPSPDLFRNTIFGAYHDVDVTEGGTIEYYVSGEYPERKFVVSYIDVAHYDCTELKTTQRIVLYETSNVIDVQIDRKDTCYNWNHGNAVIGIQNQDGDVAYVPPGRNTGNWTVPEDHPELWRFIPNANPQYVDFEFNWYDDNNNLISTGPTVTVDTTVDRVYYVTVDYDDPTNGEHYHLEDDVMVYFVDILGQPDLGEDFEACDGTTVTLDATVDNGIDYQWQKDGEDIPGANSPVLDVTEEGVYSVIVVNGVCEKQDEVQVTFLESPEVEAVDGFHVCEGNTATVTADVLNASGDETYQWQKDGTDIPGANSLSLDVTETGVYSIIVTNNNGCIGVDEVEVVFDKFPELYLEDEIKACQGTIVTIDATTEYGDEYQWQKDGVDIPGATSPTLDVTEGGLYSVTVINGACENQDETNVIFIDSPEVEAVSDFHECEGNIAVVTADVLNASGDETYQWQKDGVDIPGANDLSLEVTETATYTILVTNNEGCIGMDEVNVIFDDYPELELGEDKILCAYDNLYVESNIDDADIYEWRINGQTLPDNSPVLETFLNPGTYEVELTLQRGTCLVADAIHVEVADPVEITPIPVIYGKLEIETYGGIPPYQYSLNGEDYQDEPYFQNLQDGDYTVYVKDFNQCVYSISNIYVTNLVFPKFVTPNGDGYNDVWRVENAENTPEAELYIYDRFGKLLKVMHTTLGESWDGTYNGKPLISTDYWYMLILPDGQTFKGHFALKR